jgi:molecular chaperone HscB
MPCLHQIPTTSSCSGFPPVTAVDPTSLERGYREIQTQRASDKFAAASEPERRVAMQWAARANEAYRTLRNPSSARATSWA